jgi:DnaJ-class molecular chaperone
VHHGLFLGHEVRAVNLPVCARSRRLAFETVEQRDPYVILGVARDASPAAIRSAFRALARRHHPDRAGPASAGRFAEVRDAYATLSDTGARRACDAKLARVDRPAPHGRGSRGRGPPEPLRPAVPWGRALGPEIDELFARWLRAVGGFDLPAPRDVLHCEIMLSPAEAASGALVPMRLPASGGRTARLAIPAGIRAGTVLEFPLPGMGTVLRAVTWIGH